jgi:hypothetical protein
VTKGWRKSHNEEVYNLDPSPNITGVIKTRKMSEIGETYNRRRGDKYKQRFSGET